MGYTVEAFASKCREILKAENNPAGRGASFTFTLPAAPKE